MASTPDTAIDRYIQALQDIDPVSAKAASTAAGWASRGDSARRLYRHATRDLIQVTPLGTAAVAGSRAVCQVSLWWPARRLDAGSPWLLLVQEDGEWKVEGVKDDATYTSLFLHGRLPALLSTTDLPESPDGARWADEEIARIRAGVLRSAEQVLDCWDARQIARLPLVDAPPATLLLQEDDARYAAAHARLRDALAGRPVVALTSARAGEGKTTTACDLAIGFAEAGRRALLVDLDLRMPRLYQRFRDVEAGPGLVEAVQSGVEVERLIQPTGLPRLDVLTVGHAPNDPEEVLRSVALREVIRAARIPYDVVILDLATAVQFDDPFLALGAVDGPVATVVVTELGRTVRDDLVRARQRFAEHHCDVVGLVLNRAPEVDTLLEDDALATVTLIDAREIPEIGRIAVGLRTLRPGDPIPRDRWWFLQRDPATGALTPLRQEVALTMSGLLEGVDTPRVARAPRDAGQAVFDEAARRLAAWLGEGLRSR